MAAGSEITQLVAASPSLSATAQAAGGARAWFVGGAVRDLLLDVAVDDVDLAVDGDARTLARTLKDALGGDVFSLSDRFGTWRVLAADGFQVDVSPLRGATIEDDLEQRDFTVNAMAVELASGLLSDPFDGRRDIERRLMRLVGERAYHDDPLRPLRLPRLATTLDFTVDAETAELTRKHAPRVTEPSPERIFGELCGLIGSERAVAGMRLLDELTLTDAVLPELAALRGVEQSVYHHLDAYEHTLAVLENAVAMEQGGWSEFGVHAAPLKELLLGRTLADQLTPAGALRWAALLHDIAKSRTRVEHPDGRIGFPGHDEQGAVLAREILRRLHASERLAQHVSALTLHHLRLGYLVDRRPLERRAVWDYLTATVPVEVEVGVLSVADRTATRGRKSEQAIAAHIELAVELTGHALDFRLNRPEPLLRGDRLAAELGIEPGPELGRLLDEIAAARWAGEISTPEQAVELARRSL